MRVYLPTARCCTCVYLFCVYACVSIQASFTPTMRSDAVLSRLLWPANTSQVELCTGRKERESFSSLSSWPYGISIECVRLFVHKHICMRSWIDFSVCGSGSVCLYISYLSRLTHMNEWMRKKCRFLLLEKISSQHFILFYFFHIKNNQWWSYTSINHDFVGREKKNWLRKEHFLLRSLYQNTQSS